MSWLFFLEKIDVKLRYVNDEYRERVITLIYDRLYCGERKEDYKKI
jgi:hypothetical protein